MSQDTVDMIEKMTNLHALSLASKHAATGKFGMGRSGLHNLTGLHFVSNAIGEMFAPGAVPSLKRLKFSFQVSYTKEVFECFNFGLENLSSIEHIIVEVICFSSSLRVVDDAEFAIREAIAKIRSSNPNLEIRRVCQ